MKLKITLLALLSGFISTFAQDKMFDLLKDKTETNILYNRVFALSHANEMKTKEISTTYFLQVYHEIQRADFNNRLPKLEVIRKAATLASIKNQIPLSVLISDFESISENDLQNKFNLNASNQLELKNNETLELEKHAINIVAPIVAKSKTNEVTFVLNSDLIFNTTSREIKSIF